MIVDGKHIAGEIFSALRTEVERIGPASLTVLTCAPDFATQKFLKLKERRAQEINVPITITELDATSETSDVIDALTRTLSESDGVIVQLPFPKHINIEEVLRVLPSTHDVDAVGHEAQALLEGGMHKVLSPVAATIAYLTKRFEIEVEGKNVVVIGEGRLVGRPAAAWFEMQSAHVASLNRDSSNIAHVMKDADILVLGAGHPGLVTPDMIKEGVVIFDAGTSEEGGKLVGDADPACALKAQYFTPVPGGIGPITVAMIFENLMRLSEKAQEE